MKTGAQLFTVRDFCKTTEDFSESLKKIADIGYKTVQISGTCDYNAEWLRDELKKNDLKCVLTHISADKLINNTKKVADEHDIFDCNRIGLGYLNFEPGQTTLDEFFDTYTPVVENLHKYGKYFMYHNHATEFIKKDGKPILQHMAEHFSPDKFGFTLDTYWIQFGGGDPAQWIENFSGRVPVIHLKDFSYGFSISALGEGNINFDRIFANAEKAGTEYMLVEQDDCHGENPFDCLKRSYEFLKSRGFE